MTGSFALPNNGDCKSNKFFWIASTVTVIHHKLVELWKYYFANKKFLLLHMSLLKDQETGVAIIPFGSPLSFNFPPTLNLDPKKRSQFILKMLTLILLVQVSLCHLSVYPYVFWRIQEFLLWIGHRQSFGLRPIHH